MQADRVQVLAQQAAAGNVEAFIALVQEFAPDLRVMLAAHLDQPTALAAVESAVWSAVRSRLGEFIGDPMFATWIQTVAIEPLTAHLNQADRRAVDIQDALAHQNIQACQEALTDGRELQVAQLRQRIAALPETTRTLLTRRYRDRQRPSDIAANLMISESELAISLATARALCDWRELARPPAAGERLLPPLIEDWLNQTIDVDSRALLATNLGRDHERAAQFARQVRVHLALGACLAPFTREDAASLVRQSGLGVGDSGRVMMGDGGARPSAAARPAGSDARRPARMGTSNRQAVPLTDDTPRPSPMPWIIGGGMVLVGVAALVLMSRSAASPTRAPIEPEVSAPAPLSPPSSPTLPPTAGGSVLRPQPIAPGEPKVMLVGLTAGAQVYTGIPVELRALVSAIPEVTEVEYWAGNQLLGTAREIPFSLKWTPSQAGPVEVQVRAKIGAVTKLSSQTVSLTVMKANGNGQFTREWWSGVPGAELGMGLVRLNSTTAPTGRDLVTQFSAPRNWEDSYLQRLSGYLIPPADGDYVFWICADNEAELWLSTDESYAKRTRIARAPYIHGGAIPYQGWEHDTRQRSAPIRLRAGQHYYCEAIHKEGGGDDYVDVGWQLPDGNLQRPIPGIHLMPAPLAPTPDRSQLPPLSVTLVPTGRVYQQQPLVLRADLSHTVDVTAVEFWKGDERVASVTRPFTWTWEQPTVGTISITLRAVGAGGNVLASSAPTAVHIDQSYGSGSIRREWWTKVDGWTVADGVLANGYPDRPQGEANESRFSAPRDWGDAYFQRLRGFITPPIDGDYVFWIACDDDGELWLSPDDQPAGLRRIAVSPRILNFGIQPEDWEYNASQRSAIITLKRGQRYFVEVRHKEGNGEDHLAVGWRLPDGTLERPIPGVHLSPPTGQVPAGAVGATAPLPAPAAASMLVLWNGDNVAGGSGYASTGITKVAGSGRDGSMGLQAQLTQGFANLGWNWFSWAPDDAGSDLRTHKAISFWMRIDGANRPTSASLQFLSSPKSIQARSASIDLAALVPQFADGQWHEVVVPLDRLTAPGFDLAKVWEFNLKLQGKGTLACAVSFDDIAALPQLPATAPIAAPVAANPIAEARRPELMIWDGEGANGGAGYKGSGNGGQSPLDLTPGQGRNGAGLRARLGGGNAANVGWNWHAWSSDSAGTDLNGFAALAMWVRFTGPAAPQQMVMRLSCSPREPLRRTVELNVLARQPGLLDGAWHQVIVPLAEIAPQGHDFDRAKVWEVSFDLASTATMDGMFDVDEIGALRSLTPPPPAAALVWKHVRAINLGGETTDVDGVRMLGHRQAEADGASAATSHQPGPWLSDLNWVRGTTGVGEIRRNRSMEDKPLTIDGKVYAKGLGVHANSEIVYALDGRQSGFTAVVGVDDEVQPAAELIFQVWLDSQKVWDSGVMRKGMAKPVAIPLAGRKELRLVVDSNGPGDWDHADWANAQFLVPGGDDGALQVQLGRRATATITPKPAVDAKTRALLSTALVGTKDGLAFRVKVANGPSRVWVWVAENGAANSRQFDLSVEGVALAGVGLLPANGWEKLGPVEVTVADGTIDVVATVIKGIPQVMGILVEQPAPTPTP